MTAGSRRRGQDGRAGIGELIRRYRAAAGLTQRQLAQTAQVSLGTLRDLEQGRTRRPRWGAVEDLARGLGLGQPQWDGIWRTWQGQAATGGGRQAAAGGGGWAAAGGGGWAGRRGGAGGAGPEVRVGVLGPLMVTRAGLPVPLGSARQRAVFGLLVLHQDRWVDREAIIDTLWPDQPPASAVTMVQGHISRLRGLLDPARERGERTAVIASAGRSYRLGAGTARTDLAAFTRLSCRGANAAACGDPVRASQHYQQALALWRGHPLADIDLLRRHPAVTELRDRHADLVIRYAEAARTAGDDAEVLPHLRRLCERDRFHEPAHAHLMIALAAGGQQTAALQVFDDIRRRLDRELGIRPSSVLARAQIQVLRQQVYATAWVG